MLDAFIIEEIKKKQQEELIREQQRPRLEIPVYIYPPLIIDSDSTDKQDTVTTFEM